MLKNNINSEWILANAGSGKTTALTARVVRLLLLGVPPERIVCITYTKAAAAEMRARVLKRLRELLLMGEAEAREKIEELVGTPATEEMLTRARQLFGTVLDSTSGGVMLTTIHGFCQTILRRFPLEAGIAPHFTVLEDGAAEDVIARAKHALLTGIETADEALRDALALIGARGGEYGFEAITDDILRNRRHWVEIWRAKSPEALRDAIYIFHGVAADTTHERLERSVCEALSAAEETALRGQLPAMLAHSKKTEQKYGAGIARWLEAADRRAGIPEITKLFLKEDGELRADLLKLEAADHVKPLAKAALRYTEQLAALTCAEESFAVAVLARALLDLYQAGKAAAHALDYDDLIDHMLRLVSHPETLGWVMSKLDHRIDHLLIDEAQDNSSAQWQLARVLVEELIASNDGVGSGGLPRTLLVVGDEKQSIYSFQGAAPEQFQRYRQSFTSMLEGSFSPLAERALETSYRSAASVLAVVDAVAAQPEIAAALTKSGALHPHQLARTHAAGKVVLHPPILAPEKITLPPMTIPMEYTISQSAAQMLAENIADTAQQQLAAGARAGDILILVHKRKPMVQPLIRALQRRGIPVAGIDRLTLSEHLAVRDLFALMAWCMTITDDLALAQVLRSPLIGISDEALREYAFGRAGSLWEEVKAHYPWLVEARAHRHTTPYDFLTWVLEVSGRRRAFARRFGEEVHEVLDELKAQAAAMPHERPITLAQFYDWMSRNTRQIKREQEGEGRDEVRIMTVHGSKGLEARIVILADTVSVPTTQRERSFIARNAHGQPLPVLALSEPAKKSTRLAESKERKKHALVEEYYRLLYVALTRAKDELHLFGHASKKGEVKQGSWYAHVATVMREMGAKQTDESWVVENGGEVGAWLSSSPLEGGATECVPPSEFPLPAWLFTPPATTEQPSSIAPSRVQKAVPSPYVALAARGTRERGVRIHKLLELMQAETTPVEMAVLIAHLAPDWDAKEQNAVLTEMMTLRNAEPWLWQGTRRAEVSVTGTVEGAVVHGQIDLLIETADDITILDYKTGRAVPAHAEEIPENYQSQLALYRALVKNVYPTKPIRTAIVWTHGPKLMWVEGEIRKVG